MEIHCPNYWKNCDCPPPKGRRLKFKTEKDYKIVSVIVSSDCPTTAVVFRPKRRKNIAKKKIGCFIGNRNVAATIIDPNGNTLILETMLLNDLTKRTIFSRCKRIKGENIGYRHGILPIRKRNFYRKYLIKPDNLTPKQVSH
jgi:guanyl-specific ribonuclease Sa